MKRSEVPTPALIVDLDLLDQNIATMRSRAETLGVALRPHAKAHKCVEVGQRLAGAGAIGVSCASIAEAEAMALGGLKGILVTSPMPGADALGRIRRLLLRGADLTVVADHSSAVAGLAAVAQSAGRVLPVMVDVDVGMGRTGCTAIPDAVALAKDIAARPSLRFAGIQAYWGNLQQVMPFSERERLIGLQAEKVRRVIEALALVKLSPPIVTGGGTGSHHIDAHTGLFTEIQPGSFLFMDASYGLISIADNMNPFVPSLFVAASVVSANTPGRVIVNAGWKAFATDAGKPAAVRGAPPGATYRFMGDEHGAVEFDLGMAPPLGSMIEFVTSHCDPTVNLYSQLHVVRGDDVVDTWPIRARY